MRSQSGFFFQKMHAEIPKIARVHTAPSSAHPTAPPNANVNELLDWLEKVAGRLEPETTTTPRESRARLLALLVFA